MLVLNKEKEEYIDGNYFILIDKTGVSRLIGYDAAMIILNNF